MNQITHWLDASNVYGSTDNETKLLRHFINGLLIESNENGSSKIDLLPKCDKHVEFEEPVPNGLESCHACDGLVVPDGSCFGAGIFRIMKMCILTLI